MGKPVIYITRKIPEAILQSYQDSFDFRMWESVDDPVPRDVLLNEAASADGILCLLTEKMDAEVFGTAKNLKIAANMAVGYDNINLEAASEHDVVVTNTPDVLTETTADLTFALLMAAARRIVEANNYISDGKWEHWSPYLLAGSDVHGKKIGIVGMGRIGEAVARRAKGFGMSVLYYNRSRKHEAEQEMGVVYADLDELLDKADYVVSLIPLTEETKKLFDREAFRKMKPSAIFVNVSRGGVVDEQALHDALTENEIRAAGLDVFEKEPISASHPLFQNEKVVCLPHIGSASTETRTKMLQLCLDNLVLVLDGHEPITPVK